MYKCSSQLCRAQYTNQQADAAEGNCPLCFCPLADESGLGWRYLHPTEPTNEEEAVNGKQKEADEKGQQEGKEVLKQDGGR